jgi:hypothetical protein
MDFYFPTQALKIEDYAPVQVLALKEYYKNLFKNLLAEVNHILYTYFYYIIFIFYEDHF